MRNHILAFLSLGGEEYFLKNLLSYYKFWRKESINWGKNQIIAFRGGEYFRKQFFSLNKLWGKELISGKEKNLSLVVESSLFVHT